MTTAKTYGYGLLGLVVIAAFVAVMVGTYRHAFSRAVMVTVDAPRAGLLLDPGADVRLRGVEVGEVRSVRATASGAVISLALDRSQVGRIPADVTAAVTPSTVFGGKYVELLAPARPDTRTIAAGSTIVASSVSPEIDDLFGQTQHLLKSVPIDKLDVVLTTLARTLDGRGTEIGELLSSLDGYLHQLNDHSGALEADLETAPAVLRTYADVTPALLDVLRHSTVTATTVSTKAAAFGRLLKAARGTAARGTTFVNKNAGDLLATLHNLTPTTRLLARYSPEFPCTLEGWSNLAVNNHSLGDTYPGAQVVMTLLPGQKGYSNPGDLPHYVTNRGPECYGLPSIGAKPPRQDINDGEHAYDDHTEQVTIGNPILQFFQSSGGGLP